MLTALKPQRRNLVTSSDLGWIVKFLSEIDRLEYINKHHKSIKIIFMVLPWNNLMPSAAVKSAAPRGMSAFLSVILGSTIPRPSRPSSSWPMNPLARTGSGADGSSAERGRP
jgi:hypothetical protein